MFEVGFSELLLIMGLALLVLGPEKLPKVVGEIGRWMGRARAMARQFREQLEIEAQETARRQNQQTNSTDAPSSPTSDSDVTPAASSPTPASSEDPNTPTTPTPSAVEDYVNRHPDDPPRG